MRPQRLCWALVIVLLAGAGCSAAKKAEGGDRGRQGGERPVVGRRPRTPADRVSRVDRIMAACPDFESRAEKFRVGLARMARVASQVAALRPALDEVDRIRATKVTMMGQSVNVWVTICRLSPTADAMNPVIRKLHGLVRRCEQVVRLETIVAADYRNFKSALATARTCPSAAALDDLREAAGGYRTRIMLVRKTWTELDGKLASVERPLRTGLDALNSVANSAVRPKAQEMANHVGRMLTAVVEARGMLRADRFSSGELAETLKAVCSVKSGR